MPDGTGALADMVLTWLPFDQYCPPPSTTPPITDTLLAELTKNSPLLMLTPRNVMSVVPCEAVQPPVLKAWSVRWLAWITISPVEAPFPRNVTSAVEVLLASAAIV